MKARILVVDDEIRASKSLEVLLSQEGYEIWSTQTGREAIKNILQQDFDLVLLDLNLPDVDGHEVMRKVNRRGLDTSIIILTGYSSTDSAIAALKQGAFDYLRKPYNPDMLLKTVQNALEVQREKRAHKQSEEALRKSEQKYRSLFNDALDMIHIVDANGIIIDANPAELEHLGYTRDEYLGKPLIEIIRPDYRDEANKALQRIFEGEQVKAYQTTLITKQGEEIDVEVNAVPLQSNGEINGAREIIRDITKRKQAERALRKERDFAESLIQTAQAIVLVLDNQGRIVHYNFFMENLTGYRIEEVQGRDWFSTFLPGNDHDHIRQLFKNAVGDIQTRGNINPILTKDGRKVFIEWYDKTLKDPDGGVLGLLAIGLDITERRNAEKLVWQSEADFISLFNSASDAIFLHDLTGQIIEVNEAACKRLGYAHDELLKMTPMDFNTPEHVEKVPKRLKEVQRNGNIRFETVHVARNGNIIHVEIISQTMNFKGKQVVMSTARDITEQKRMEEEREKLQAQLFQAQKMESVGRLAGGVAHDFNNMLSVILGHTELALEGVDPTEGLRADLLEIQQAARRSADITRQLLAFARKQIIDPKVVGLNENVEGMIKMLKRLIGEDIDLAWHPATNLWTAKMDPAQIDQLLANLCVNARDAIEDLGKITIETKNVVLDESYCAEHAGFVPGEYVMLAVSDDGCGMDKEVLVNIFDPFFTTKEVGMGTGLGLSTVYGIAKQNRGSINVYSEPGKGTTFKVYLPRHVGEAEVENRETKDQISQGLGETILVVEDEPSVLSVSKRMLESLGYTVLPAGSPGEAVDLAAGFPGEIHLLMSDVVMPEMNGKDLADAITAVRPNIKILFISGYTANAIVHRGILDKSMHFEQKPFTKESLARKVREVLERDGHG